MLGIENYALNYLHTCEEVLQFHKPIFKELIGKSIDAYFVQWELNSNEWNADGPIIILIEGMQYEFTAYQLDYSLTRDKIKRTDKLDWYGSGDEMPLQWKENAFEHINAILHQPINKIYGLEYGQGSSFHLVGFEFELEGINDCLHLSNGLDCNIIQLYQTIPDNRNRRIEIK